MVCLGLFAGCGPYDPKSAADLAECYKVEFGAPPPAGITVIKARQMVIRDWGGQWLKLHAESNLVDSIILERFTKTKGAPHAFRSGGANAPDWWILPPADELEFYRADEWTKGSFQMSSATVAVHRSSGTVFFRCDRVD